ncbi:MAG: protoheme IX farnesyltransferase [Anaerolineaceae bacterium]|nr:protoheme IX farnesyltransferase [Anaerolineaceae bacterium]
MASLVRSDQRLGQLFKAYRELMKMRIVALLVFTCVTAMFVAAQGVPDLGQLLATIVGGMLSAGGASALNQFIDRDMDAKMKRTAHRPLPSGRIKPINALLFGIGLVGWSVLVLGLFVNWLAALLAFIGAIYYVVLYTIILKRNTVVNIVIGGGAGAMPVLVGWAAVTGSLSLEAFLLFAIVFYWTPPHSWALALLVNADYAAAEVPMMPVARGERTTQWQILFYSIQLVLVTLLPAASLLLPNVEFLGFFYFVSALLLGIGMIQKSVQLIRESNKPAARRLYKYSSMYLALLFLAMIVDSLLRI